MLINTRHTSTDVVRMVDFPKQLGAMKREVAAESAGPFCRCEFRGEHCEIPTNVGSSGSPRPLKALGSYAQAL